MQTLPQRRLHWTLALPATPEQVLPALQTAITGDIRQVSRGPSRLVLSCSPGDLSLRVSVDLRADGERTELVLASAGQRTAGVYVFAVALTVLVLLMGVAICRSGAIALGLMLIVIAVGESLYLVRDRRESLAQRHAEFTRIAGAVDRALTPLKPQDPRLYRALAPGDGDSKPRRSRGRRY